MAIRFKPRPRSRRPGLGAGGSPSKRTRGFRRPNRKEKPDYASRLPRPTMPEAKSVASERRVVEEKATPDPIMPTRPTSPEPPQVSTETRAQPGRMPGEELSRKPPVSPELLQKDPFTVKPSPVKIPDATDAVGFPEVDFDREVTKEFIPSGGMEIQVPKQRQQVGTLPFITSGSRLLPLVTEENQPSTLPAPAGFGLPVKKQGFVDPFNFQKETYGDMEVSAPFAKNVDAEGYEGAYFPTDPDNLAGGVTLSQRSDGKTTFLRQPRVFGIRKPDGSFFSPQETKTLRENYSDDELRSMFGEAAVVNVLSQ